MSAAGTATLSITYRAPGQRPMEVATLEDEILLRQAARVAMEQAEEHAAAVASEDPIMGMLQAAEARRLRAALDILIPGFAAVGNSSDPLQ